MVTAGEDVTVKPVRGEPPVAVGRAQAMATEVVDVVADATTEVAALGRPVVTELEADEAVLLPRLFLAVTVKV